MKSSKKDFGKVEEYHVFTPSNVELTQNWETIYEALDKLSDFQSVLSGFLIKKT